MVISILEISLRTHAGVSKQFRPVYFDAQRLERVATSELATEFLQLGSKVHGISQSLSSVSLASTSGVMLLPSIMTLLCQVCRPSITTFPCPVLGLTPRAPSVEFCSLVLNPFGHDHIDGHMFACSFQQLNFSLNAASSLAPFDSLSLSNRGRHGVSCLIFAPILGGS